MRTLIYLVSLLLICSCAENSKKNDRLEIQSESSSSAETNQQTTATNDNSTETTKPQLNDLLNMSKGILENSAKNEDKNIEFDASALLDMLEARGVSRSEMEKLISNPDSLKALTQKAIKDRENDQREREVFENKGRLSKEQLTSKNTPTGISLEEAILLVQAESGPEVTMEKLKTIDSLAGTNVMAKLDLTKAGYVMRDVEQKNEPKASTDEVEKIEKLRLLTGQLHSEREARELLAKLEKTENDIESGILKASPRYQRAIKYQKGKVRIYHGSIIKKSKVAMKKFQKLNPDLYYGEDVGHTYIGYMRKAVYLPLGKLSFADKVIKAYHPQLKTKHLEFVLGEPDGIISYEVRDDSGIYSLGLGGDLTVQFSDNALTDVNGPDLYIFEMGAIEPTDLEISKDGKNWIYVGKIDGGVAEVDIAPFVNKGELFYYVRLKDLKTKSGEPGADVDAIAAIGSALRLNLDSQVLFDSGKSVLKPEGISAIKELVNNITVLKKGKVIVEGHTDDVGSDATNNALSLARAKSVSKALKQFIPSADFKWQEKGYGESKPLMKNDSDINRSKNRRVEILVVPN